MSPPSPLPPATHFFNTLDSLTREFTDLGVRPGTILMVHSSLGRTGWTVGGAVTVIRALLEVLAPDGTLVMPAESPSVSDPATWDDPRVRPEWHAAIREHLPVFHPLTTPTTMGAIPEAFRTFPGTLRSAHPLVSVCANGPCAREITVRHELEFGEGAGTPFEKLYDMDSCTLLLGVGFNRCTSLHFAESRTPGRRTAVSRYPLVQDGKRVWVAKPDMAADNSTHFPVVGQRFLEQEHVRLGTVGQAQAMLFSTRTLVDFAEEYFRAVLPT